MTIEEIRYRETKGRTVRETSCIVDTDTGEILKKVYTRNVAKMPGNPSCIGTTIQFPSEALTKEEFIGAFSILDAYHNNPIVINYEAILNTEWETDGCENIYILLCNNIVGWNHGFISISDLEAIPNYRKHLATLQSSNFVKPIQTMGGYRGQEKIIHYLLSPFYVWKGGEYFKENKLHSFYKS